MPRRRPIGKEVSMVRCGWGIAVSAALLTVAAGRTGVSAAPPSAAGGDSTATKGIAPEVRYLATGILAARARLRSWTATVTCVKEQTLEGYRYFEQKRADQITGRPRLTRSVETAKWRCEEPRLSVSVQHSDEPIPGTDVLQSEDLVVDFKTTTYLQTYVRAARSPEESDETRRSASIAPVGSEIAGNVREGFSHLDPRRIAFFTGSVPLDREFTNPAVGATFVGSTVYDGAHCLKVEYRVGKEGTVVVGVDADHGFVVRTREQYVAVRGKRVLTDRSLTTKVAEEGGVWMPAVVEREVFAPRVFLPEYRGESDPTKTVLLLRERATITDFTANPRLPARTFTLDLPPGTDISDHTTDREKPASPRGPSGGR
jgi:hypothetical protein